MHITIFRKEKKMTFRPHPLGQWCVYKGEIFASILLYALFPLIWYATWQFSENVDFISASLTPAVKSFMAPEALFE